MKAPIENREIADKFTKTNTDNISRLVPKDFIDGFRTGVERWLDYQSDMRDKGIEHRAKYPLTEEECISAESNKPYTFLPIPASEIMVGIKSGETWSNGRYMTISSNNEGVLVFIPWRHVADFLETNKPWEKQS